MREHGAGHHGSNDLVQTIEIEGIEPGQFSFDAIKNRQRGGVAITFTQTKITVIGFHLNDGTQGVRLVNAARIEQRRILEGNRRDGDSGDFHIVTPLNEGEIKRLRIYFQDLFLAAGAGKEYDDRGSTEVTASAYKPP